MKRLVTVLGKGRRDNATGQYSYEQAKYRFPSGKVRTGTLFAALAAKEYGAGQIHCLATDDAWNLHGKALRDAASPVPVVQHRVDAILGEAELWHVFERVVGIPECGDALILDFTHGFRSMPLVGVVAASVAARVHHATIEGLVYGAFEQKDCNGVAPVVDLMPFYDLLRWQAASDEFARTGLAGSLAAIEVRGGSAPGWLNSFRTHARGLALALTMMNPTAAELSARKLKAAVSKASGAPGGAKVPAAPQPWPTVAGWVGEACAPFLKHDNTTPEGRLRHEADLIRWYRERGHYTQAVTLFREWLVSLVGWALTEKYLLVRDERKQVESCLGYLQARARKPQARPRGEVREDFLEKVGTLNWRQELLDTLGPITEVRNNIAHCGMGRREGAPSGYAKIIDKLVDGPLGALIEKSGLGRSETASGG